MAGHGPEFEFDFLVTLLSGEVDNSSAFSAEFWNVYEYISMA
jgi:hypothetical protein